MAIPISYNLRSVAARWKAAVVSVIGIAGTVGVFVAMLAMARGFQATLISSGSTSNAIIRRAGASSEMDSGVSLDQSKVIADAPQVAETAVDYHRVSIEQEYEKLLMRFLVGRTRGGGVR